MNDDFKIGEGEKWLMLCVAILFDIISLVSLIPIVGWFLDWGVWIFSFMTFWLWFKMNGMSFSNPKNLGGFLGASTIELIPYIDLIPSWTFMVLYLTRIKKIVDKTKNNIVNFPQRNKPGTQEQNNLDRAA